MSAIKAPKKLIEVALPLDDINAACAREKSIRHGHPSTLHLWWARRPLAAARAVLFAQMVNDPGGERGYYAGKTKAQAEQERNVLFDIIRDLVKWENTNNEEVLERARAAIRQSWRETCELNRGRPGFDPEQLPAFHDPFAGGGAIPLEAQRLGLEAHASDLNPVAVLINKAMIEIPPRFAGRAPVGPEPALPTSGKDTVRPGRSALADWSGARGLAEDVRRYGHWMREQAERRIGHLYPKIGITEAMAAERPDLKPLVGEKLTVIAWLWARTVKSPNPAFRQVDVPLASSFVLATKKDKEAYVEPVIEGDDYRFTVRVGTPPVEAKGGTTAGKRNAFICLMSGSPIDYKYIRSEGKAGRMGARMMAVVAEGKRGRIYLSPTDEMIDAASRAVPDWRPENPLPDNTRDFKTPNYGLTTYGDLFTPRQLVALTTFSDLVGEARERVIADSITAGLPDDGQPLSTGGTGATAYGDAIATYLALALDKGANLWSTVTSWMSDRGAFRETFARQAIPMVWDYAEANPFSNSGGNVLTAIDKGGMAVDWFPTNSKGAAALADAQSLEFEDRIVVSTDPPYYDNIGYADLSDFFYVWLRRSLRAIHPELFATLAVPKAEELVATPYRHGGKAGAEKFFLDGMTRAIHNLAEQAHPAFPVTIYYAFKQAETKAKGTSSTGWETFLAAVIQAGFAITGTWPLRTEGSGRIIARGSNALASSIVLVCRRREARAPTASRREFQRELREEMPEALETMIGGRTGVSPIAPVDLAQAALGPGMALYSRHAAVLDADGTPMPVHDALVLINKAVDDFLNPDGADFDADTLFCSAWFSEHGWASGKFGEAETLSRAKGTSVAGLQEAGVVETGAGKVRLLKWAEYPKDWDPTQDNRTPIWEAAHQMIRALSQQGESEAGRLLARMPERGEPIRRLAYHLYTLCERRKWAEEARAYDELVTAWPHIVAASEATGHVSTTHDMFGEP